MKEVDKDGTYGMGRNETRGKQEGGGTEYCAEKEKLHAAINY